ncbi:hypothetical protein M1555_04165 [Patescibacteria group bacterium]|nr:hypothetical protein [Patescibacteria group bacterium]
MPDALYEKFVRRWEEVIDLPPQTLGPFTAHYKTVTRHFKVMPWPLLVLLAFGVATLLYFFVGSAITLLVSLLQRGF